jgi:hypothetical protein
MSTDPVPPAPESTPATFESAVQAWLSRSQELPRQLLLLGVARVKKRYKQLEARYGKDYAMAILAAGIVGTAVPLPGTSLLAAAPVIALAETHRAMAPRNAPVGSPLQLPGLALERLGDLGRWFIDELRQDFASPEPGTTELEAFLHEKEHEAGRPLSQDEVRCCLEEFLTQS